MSGYVSTFAFSLSALRARHLVGVHMHEHVCSSRCVRAQEGTGTTMGWSTHLHFPAANTAASKRQWSYVLCMICVRFVCRSGCGS